eukprot:CAMPEP_0196210552 /NCGR_PEP_ID=MMETSP0912-20130531/13809_1 /TAXON_ID=49265 /ORGANISM="Thalassiosira rotula, Strain GSO102" /LENGTH=132 /DNA_ID=CAMNT_0041485819 /DNA_START=87 /DNA_END=482 /DNA_ORIENTATION=+
MMQRHAHFGLYYIVEFHPTPFSSFLVGNATITTPSSHHIYSSDGFSEEMISFFTAATFNSVCSTNLSILSASFAFSSAAETAESTASATTSASFFASAASTSISTVSASPSLSLSPSFAEFILLKNPLTKFS